MKKKKYVLCIHNHDCPDLEAKKVYEVLPDLKGDECGQIRVIDESQEDYLYPKEYFVAIDLPQVAIEALKETA